VVLSRGPWLGLFCTGLVATAFGEWLCANACAPVCVEVRHAH